MSSTDFNYAGFSDWFAAQTGCADTLSVEPITGGGSCEMFDVRCGPERYVVRRAPLAAVSSTAHDVVREFRVIEALQGSAARVPEVVASCEDGDVLGSPFYVMRFVDGAVIRRRLPDAYVAEPPLQPRIGEELIDALVELHAAPWRDTALDAMAHPEGFLERQVARWLRQLDSYRHRELDGVDSVAQWLEANRPPQGDLTVMHGDYKIDNAIFSHRTPPAILTLVDFEMTTVGDPLIDLAWAMIFWPEEGNLIAIAAPGSEGGMDERYCQSPQELIARYSERSGRSVDNLQWYQAFAAWKLGIVLEASYAKHVAGESQNPNHAFFGMLVDELMQRAQRFAV